MDNLKFAIKWNNCQVKELCPLCNHLHDDAVIPFWVFIEDYYVICEDCAKKNAPELLEMVKYGNKKYNENGFLDEIKDQLPF